MENGEDSSESILTKRVSDPERSLTKREKRELAKEGRREESKRNESKSKFKKIALIVVGLLVISYFGYKGWKWMNTPGYFLLRVWTAIQPAVIPSIR